MMNKFWIWFIRLMIVLITMASMNEAFADSFYIRFILIFIAFALFEVSDYFVKKEDNDDSPPIAGV